MISNLLEYMLKVFFFQSYLCWMLQKVVLIVVSSFQYLDIFKHLTDYFLRMFFSAISKILDIRYRIHIKITSNALLTSNETLRFADKEALIMKKILIILHYLYTYLAIQSFTVCNFLYSVLQQNILLKSASFIQHFGPPFSTLACYSLQLENHSSTFEKLSDWSSCVFAHMETLHVLVMFLNNCLELSRSHLLTVLHAHILLVWYRLLICLEQ